MNIENYGQSKRCKVAKELFLKAFCDLHLVFLPIPTSRDGKHVSGTDTEIGTIAEGACENTLVVGYNIPLSLCDALLLRGARYLDLALDEKFQYENSKISAQGALGYILSSFNLAPCDMKIGIVGYGRIGKELFSYLKFLGASPRVYTTSEKSALELSENGVDVALCIGGVRDFTGLDLLINTAPTDLSASFKDGKIPENMRVIELASGENFPLIKGVERLPSIPEKMYPDSAGYLYYKAIRRFLKEE